jgi:TrkA-N domain/Sodium/hydrogen exchanger family
VLPFKGILLGIFFMDAGSTFDSELVLAEWPTIVVGAIALLLLKAITLGAATRVPRWMEPNRLAPADALRVALLLSGGGEFAFVVLALAEKMAVIPQELSAILTAIVLITMGVTPLLGQLAATLSEPLLGISDVPHEDKMKTAAENGDKGANAFAGVVAYDAIVVSGYGEIGRSLLRVLDSEIGLLKKSLVNNFADIDTVNIVAFDTDPLLVNSVLMPSPSSMVVFGNGASAEVIRSSGITNPAAIFVSYEDHSRALAATVRLRASFANTPIYARAATRAEVLSLGTAGATEVVVEADELPRAAPSLVRGVWRGNLVGEFAKDEEQVRQAAALAAGVSVSDVDQLLVLFSGMDQDVSGLVSVSELENVLERTTNWIATDDEIAEFDAWVEAALRDLGPLDAIEFCRLYGRAPDFVKKAFGVTRETKKR